MEIKILNLTVPSQGTVPFHINKFPDGQRSITLLKPEELYKKTHTVIVQSICTFQDWEILFSAVSAVKSHTYEYSVYIPYLLGARSDRKFVIGGDMYHHDINERMLEMLECPIIVLDLHCESDLITTFHPMQFWDYTKILPSAVQCSRIFPDESAAKRFHNYGLHSPQEVIMKKERTEKGIVQTPINNESEFNLTHNKVHVIMDDLFDGGRSFLELIKSFDKPNRICLCVSHFIGSSLDILHELKELNVEIITTNSYKCSDKVKDCLNVVVDVFNQEYVKRIVEINVLQTWTPSCPF